MYSLLRFVPKNYLSFLVGRFVRTPGFYQRALINWFIKSYQVDLSGVLIPAGGFTTLGELFVRDLEPGMRPIGSGVVSPVDGALTQYGEITGGQIIQSKGKTYSVSSLLADRDLGSRFLNGYFLTFYLAPPDYHHIHAPVGGLITQTRHIPGKLWPVNSWSVENIQDLFSVNERVVTLIEGELGLTAVVMVGATNVGSIKLAYDDLITNTKPALFCPPHELERRTYQPPKKIIKGERLGTFQMGSSVIVLFEHKKFVGSKLSCRKVVFGESL